MLQPARRKYRKEQKGRNKGISHERGTAVSFGEYGLKATGRGRLTARLTAMHQSSIPRLTRRRAAARAVTMANQLAVRAQPARLPVAVHPRLAHQPCVPVQPSSWRRPLLLQHQLKKQENNHAATSTQEVS